MRFASALIKKLLTKHVGEVSQR